MTDAALTDAELERVREAFANVPFAHLIGIELGAVERGAATLHLSVRDELKQNKGLTHGGVIASLIDTAAAFAIMTLLKPDETAATIDLAIHYLRPLIAGHAIARARVLRAGRRVIVVSVNVTSESEVVVASALTSYLRLP